MIVVLFAITACATRHDQTLRPFRSNGCTMSPDFNFRACCVTHDYAYWKGGTKEERYKADDNLRSCINDKRKNLGTIYFAMTRLVGSSHLPTSFLWGFGWHQNRPLNPLTADELNYVKEFSLKYLKMQQLKCENGDKEACVHHASVQQAFLRSNSTQIPENDPSS